MTRTTWPQATELQQAADLIRDTDPQLAEWLDATANALAWLAPYRDHEPGYAMWEAASKVARMINSCPCQGTHIPDSANCRWCKCHRQQTAPAVVAQNDGWRLTPQTLDLFVRALVNHVDYDIHKGYECGEDHYPELVDDAAEMLDAITREQPAAAAPAVVSAPVQPTTRADGGLDAAARLEASARKWDGLSSSDYDEEAHTAKELRAEAAELRRMAGEEQPATETPEVVHGCPPDGSGLTPCCGRTPFELPRSDRISSEAPITCPGIPVAQQPATEAEEPCTCADAGDCFAPAGHYADCPAAVVARQDGATT